MAAKFKRNLQ